MGPFSGESVPSPMRYRLVRALSLTSILGSLIQEAASAAGAVMRFTGDARPPWTGEMRAAVETGMGSLRDSNRFRLQVAQVLELALHLVALLLGELLHLALRLPHQVAQDVD